ncbi:hypothetical protein QBC34DRAFT_164120 [Podospora aff. communis PSN243]|uniref:GPI inositol-deacylase n=1 Tax=Podospora aff. communis PSN243 TaxID=3040156 RepID=A0AAV9GBI1_9PEZI|nr:hypothetical protein QBC34DRAFT_164120 [Podospora aff. communis PSN243]
MLAGQDNHFNQGFLGGRSRLHRLLHGRNKGSFRRDRKPILSSKPGLAVHHYPSSDATAAPIIDIIALHGCDRNFRSWSFQAKSDQSGAPIQVDWLCGPQGIAKEIPNARIMTFSFDINVRSSYELIHRSLYGNSLRLLQDLSSLRRETKSEGRGIIFIAHSVGGLLLKLALVSCIEPTGTRFRDIRDSTSAVHLFGTPSSSSSSHAFHVALDNMFALVRGGLKKEAREPLSRLDSGWLEMKLQPFKALMSTMAVFSYYESLETLDIGMVVNRQRSFSSTHSRNSESSTGSQRTFLNSDHLNMMRFQGPGDKTYIQLLRSLRDFARNQGREKSRSAILDIKPTVNADPEIGALNRRGNLAALSNIPAGEDLESFESQEALFPSLFSPRDSKSAGFPLIVLWGEDGTGVSTTVRSLLCTARRRAPDAFMYRFEGKTSDTIMEGYLALFRSIYRQAESQPSAKDFLGIRVTNLHDILSAESVVDLDDVSLNTVRKCVLEWLLDPEKQEWWLVFENVVDPDGIYELSPLRGSGRIILTTSQSDALHLGEKRRIPPSHLPPTPQPLGVDQELEHQIFGPVLKIAALLSTDPIPFSFFRGSSETPRSHVALDLLIRLGFADAFIDNGRPLGAIRLHDGVRLWVQTRLVEKNESAKWAMAALRLWTRFYQLQTAPRCKLLSASEGPQMIAPDVRACYQSIKDVMPEDLPPSEGWDLLGRFCIHQGAYDEASFYLGQFLSQPRWTSETALSEEYVQATLWLSTARRRMGKLGDAAEELKRLEFEKMIEESGIWPLAIKTELARADLSTVEGHLQSAQQTLERLLDFLDNIEDEPAKGDRLELDRAIVTRRLASLAAQQGNTEAASAYYQRAFTTFEHLLGHCDPTTIDTGEEWVNNLRVQGRHAEALELLERFLSVKQMLLGGRHPSTASRMVTKADLLSEVGNFGEATKLYDDALAIMTSTLGTCHPRVLRTMRCKAASLAARGSYDDALKTMEHVIQQMKSLPLWYTEEDVAWAVAKQDEFAEQRSGTGFEHLLQKSLCLT